MHVDLETMVEIKHTLANHREVKFDVRDPSPGEVWSWRMVGGFSLLRQKRRHPSGHNHPCSHCPDAALHRRVRLLLQVRPTLTCSRRHGAAEKRFMCSMRSFSSVSACVRPRRRKSQQAEREYEKVKHQLENLEESVRDRCKKEFTGKP